MFSLQLHIALDSPLGQRLGLLQHIVAVAIVNSILKQPGYEVSLILISKFFDFA
jgi:biotin--protein ligase